MDESSYVAIGLSKDDQMGNDLVLFCMRNDYMETIEEKVGIGLNSYNRTNFIYGTVAFIENKLPFNLELLGYSQTNRNVYCRVRHRIRPLQKILNGTVGNILVARGHWINNHGLSYHGKYRMSLGQFDLTKKGKSEECSCTISSSWELPTKLVSALTLIIFLLMR